MIDEIKVCLRCGKEYQPFNSNQKYCSDCRPIVYKENQERYRHNGGSRPLKVCLNCGKEFFPLKGAQKWCEECQPVMKHVSQITLARAWREAHAPKDRENRRRDSAKRNRELDYIPLNKPFEGCVGHHIDPTFVIFIPSEMHRSVSHDVRSGRGMVEINRLAFAFLRENRDGNQ